MFAGMNERERTWQLHWASIKIDRKLLSYRHYMTYSMSVFYELNDRLIGYIWRVFFYITLFQLCIFLLLFVCSEIRGGYHSGSTATSMPSNAWCRGEAGLRCGFFFTNLYIAVVYSSSTWLVNKTRCTPEFQYALFDWVNSFKLPNVLLSALFELELGSSFLGCLLRIS